MVVRPLDLASRLRPPPASWDWLFYVDAALLAFLFVLFGSRFVLSPAVAMDGDVLRPPRVAASALSLTTSTAVVSIKANGQIFTPDTGRTTVAQLRPWLEGKARSTPDASLLIVADANVSYAELSRVYATAAESGFKRVAFAAEPASSEGNGL